MGTGVQPSKINGKALKAEDLTGDLDYFAASVTVTGVNGATSDAVNQANIDRIIATVGRNAQPILLGTIAASSANPSVVTFNFAIEHTRAWGNGTDVYGKTANVVSLKGALDATATVASIDADTGLPVSHGSNLYVATITRREEI